MSEAEKQSKFGQEVDFAKHFTFEILFCKPFYIWYSILPNILYFRFTFAKDFRFTNLCAFILTVNGHSNIIATQSKFGQKVGFAKRFTFEIWDLVLPNMFGQEFGFAKRFVDNSDRNS